MEFLVDPDVQLGSIWIGSQGYLMHGKDSLVHRTVMELLLGRKLTTKERVHHKNRNRLDARRENLQLCADDKEHFRVHALEDIERAGFSYSTHSWCTYHQRYEIRSEFSTRPSHWTGLHNTCRNATNEYQN